MCDSGLNPLFHFGLKYIYLAVIHLFVITYLSKSLNLSEKSSKIIKMQNTDAKPDFCTVSPHLGNVRPSVGCLGCREKVEGKWEGAQGAAPSAASLQPSCSFQNSENRPRHSQCVSRSVT